MLFPINRGGFQGGDLGDSSSTPSQQEKPRAGHRLCHPGKEPRAVLGAELLRQRSAWLEIMTGLDGSDGERLPFEDKAVKASCEGMPSPVDGRGCQTLLMLWREKSLDISPGDLPQGLVHLRTAQTKIQAIARERVGRIVSHAHVRTEARDFHGRQRSPPQRGLASGHRCHRLIILGAFRRLVEWGIAQRDLDRAVAHHLFQHLERHPSMESVRGAGVAKAVGRILRRELSPRRYFFMRQKICGRLQGVEPFSRPGNTSWEGGGVRARA